MEKNNKSKITKIKIVLITLLIISTTAFGLTYAYFTLRIVGNDTASSMSVTTADLRLTYTDGNVISISKVFPGWSATKTFSVTNPTSSSIYYDIKLQDVYGTFTEDELVYTLTSTNGGGTKSETIMPTNDGLIKAKILISANTTQTYTMTITFKEMNYNQDHNQKATYTGKIQIISPYSYLEGSVNNIKLTDRIMIDNTTAYPTNTSSKYVTASTGINYANPSDHAYDGYFIYEEDVNFTSNGNKYLGTSFSFASSSGVFTVKGTTSSSQTYSESSIDKYTCNDNNSKCYYNMDDTSLYKILEVNGSIVTKVERYKAKPNKSSWNGLGLYQTSTNTINNQPTYFFRGHVVNNYVRFAGDLWRIVRINEDGSIRLIKENMYVKNKFNNGRNNEMYVGYMFGTSADPYANTYDSNAKIKVEEYYDNFLEGYSDYLAPIEFCNDRSIASVSGTTTVYGAGARSSTPSFACPNESRDLFTMNTSSRGNKKLTKPIGLITYDEMAYAGARYNKISKFYFSNKVYYTVTPLENYSSGATIFAMMGTFTTSVYPDGSGNPIHPVVSLKADTLVLGGSGSANDPYIVTQ